jgi:hypothetical protein
MAAPTVALAACQIPGFTGIEGPKVSYVSVATGDVFVCGLTGLGEISCWRTADPRPNLLSAPVRFESISTTAGHACALTESREACCWGANDVGQLGTTTELPECRTSYSGSPPSCSTTPDRVYGRLHMGRHLPLPRGSGKTETYPKTRVTLDQFSGS